MPREIVLLSTAPVTGRDCAEAAAADGLRLARLWNGGGMQIADDDGPVLAVLRSARIDRPDDVRRLLGVAVPSGAAWLTELYGPSTALGARVVGRLADRVGAVRVERGIATNPASGATTAGDPA